MNEEDIEKWRSWISQFSVTSSLKRVGSHDWYFPDLNFDFLEGGHIHGQIYSFSWFFGEFSAQF